MKTIWTWILSIAATWSLMREDFRGAKDRLEQLRSLSEKRNGYNHIKTVPILFKLAICYQRLGGADNFRQALIIYENALRIAESSSANNKDLLIGQIANEMADWYFQTGNYEKADALYQKSIEAYERRCGHVSLHLLAPLYGRAKVLKSQGKLQEAKDLEQKAYRIEEAHASMADTYEYHGHYPRF